MAGCCRKDTHKTAQWRSPVPVFSPLNRTAARPEFVVRWHRHGFGPGAKVSRVCGSMVALQSQRVISMQHRDHDRFQLRRPRRYNPASLTSICGFAPSAKAMPPAAVAKPATTAVGTPTDLTTRFSTKYPPAHKAGAANASATVAASPTNEVGSAIAAKSAPAAAKTGVGVADIASTAVAYRSGSLHVLGRLLRPIMQTPRTQTFETHHGCVVVLPGEARAGMGRSWGMPAAGSGSGLGLNVTVQRCA
jgi:hypothetical protein